MTVFTEYLAAVRAYEQELKLSGTMRSAPPLKSVDELADDAERLFHQLVQTDVKTVAPAVAAAAMNSQLRGV